MTSQQIIQELLQEDTSSDWHTPWNTGDYVFIATEAVILLAIITLGIFFS